MLVLLAIQPELARPILDAVRFPNAPAFEPTFERDGAYQWKRDAGWRQLDASPTGHSAIGEITHTEVLPTNAGMDPDYYLARRIL